MGLYGKRYRSASGCSAALHNPRLTDHVYSLQAGKTVDISRCASEINRLAFRLPHCLGYIRGLRPRPPSPKAGRLPVAAGHRAAVVDIGDDAGGGGVLRSLYWCESHCIIVVGYVVPLIPYQKTNYSAPYLSVAITSIGDNETFDYSRLRRNFASVICECQCKPSVVEHSLRATASVRCEGDNAVSCARKVARMAPFPACWGYYAPRCQRCRHRRAGLIWKEVCSQQPGKPVSSLHPTCPHPHRGDERPGTSLRITVSAVPRRINIIYRDCITGRMGPQPHRLCSLRIQSRLC